MLAGLIAGLTLFLLIAAALVEKNTGKGRGDRGFPLSRDRENGR
jgi:hypothetical protein